MGFFFHKALLSMRYAVKKKLPLGRLLCKVLILFADHPKKKKKKKNDRISNCRFTHFFAAVSLKAYGFTQGLDYPLTSHTPPYNVGF